MLTPAEKRFIKYWEEQRTGGKRKYYLLYILGGTFIAVIVLSFLYAIFISPVFSFDTALILILVTGFLVVTLSTVITWNRNEKRFRQIIRREVEEGRSQDKK